MKAIQKFFSNKRNIIVSVLALFVVVITGIFLATSGKAESTNEGAKVVEKTEVKKESNPTATESSAEARKALESSMTEKSEVTQEEKEEYIAKIKGSTQLNEGDKQALLEKANALAVKAEAESSSTEEKSEEAQKEEGSESSSESNSNAVADNSSSSSSSSTALPNTGNGGSSNSSSSETAKEETPAEPAQPAPAPEPTPAPTPAPQPAKVRTGQIGNTGKEFATFEEADAWAQSIFNNDAKLIDLHKKGFSSYFVGPVGYSDGSRTYTVWWQ